VERILKPGEGIDELPEPLDSVEDVEEVMRMVEEEKGAHLAAAIRKASLN
jgi:hypothetical protein